MLIGIIVFLALVFVLPCVSGASDAPVFRPEVKKEDIDRLKKEMAQVLALPDIEILRLIPTQSGFRFVGCPNCEGGAEENQITWQIDRPDEVFCQFCEMVFPNAQYPENGVMHVTNARGEVQTYAYWEGPDVPPRPLPGSLSHVEKDKKYRHYFWAKGWYVAREFFSDAAWKLSQLYDATGDLVYAKRAALILDRFAQVYPGYCARYDSPFRQKVVFSGDQTFPYPVQPYLSAKWDYWAYGDIPSNLIRAYDLIRNSGVVDRVMAHRVEDDLIRASVQFVRSYPITLSNMDPTILRGLISAGRVLNEPAYVHDAVDWIGQLIQRQFFADGMWRECAVSYHNQTVYGLASVMDLLRGYSDPVDYSGARFENLDLSEKFPLFKKALQIPDLLRYPNGRTVSVHDTWAREKRQPTHKAESGLLGGAGHAWLGRGEGPHQMQAHLHFSGAYGHAHTDLLSMTLFSHGQERLSDIGYTWTHHRHWASCTLSHSTVMVNGEDQKHGSEKRPSDGNLVLFVPGDGVFQVVEADGQRAYPDIVREYRRALMVVGVSPEDAYVVDLFRVAGGTRHDYVLVGDANHDGEVETGLERVAYGKTLLPPEVKVQFPTGENVPGDAEGHNFVYAYVKNVEKAALPGPWQAVLRSAGTPDAALRIHGISEQPGDLLIGQAPSVRRAEEQEGRLNDFTMPLMLQRRDGKDLESTFLHVLEPFQGNPFLHSVAQMDVTAGDAVAIQIAWEGGTDYLIYALGDKTVQVGGMTMKGQIGFVRERGGKVERMTLVGGTRLEKGQAVLESGGLISGQVVGVMRQDRGDALDGLVVTGAELDGVDVAGLTVVVKDGAGFSVGCTIAGIELVNGRTVIRLTHDPGFEMDADGTSKHVYFPGRTWTGENRFEIATVGTRVF